MAVEVRAMTDDDREAAFGIAGQAFDQPPLDPETIGSRSIEDRFVAVVDGRVSGFVRVLRAGQFFGGRSLPWGGLAAVSVAPEARGAGVGTRMVAGVLQLLRKQGVSIAGLYSSTMAPYRKAGFEVAGARMRYRVPLEALPRENPAGYTIETWDDADLGDVHACYREFAAARNGLLDRPRDRAQFSWPLILEPPEHGRLYRYRVVRAGRTTGYAVYQHVPEPSHFPFDYTPGDGNLSYTLACRDLVWRDSEAARALLGLASSQRVWGTAISWTGPADEPLASLMPERMVSIDGGYFWMARLLDVAGALEGRGYPRRLDASVSLAVRDDVIDANRGVYTIRAEGGRATVAKVSDGRGAKRRLATVDVRGLAGMFTGWMPARTAVTLGWLGGATAREVEALEAMFAGPSPWMLESF